MPVPRPPPRPPPRPVLRPPKPATNKLVLKMPWSNKCTHNNDLQRISTSIKINNYWCELHGLQYALVFHAPLFPNRPPPVVPPKPETVLCCRLKRPPVAGVACGCENNPPPPPPKRPPPPSPPVDTPPREGEFPKILPPPKLFCWFRPPPKRYKNQEVKELNVCYFYSTYPEGFGRDLPPCFQHQTGHPQFEQLGFVGP